MSPCLIPRCGCSWEGGVRQELGELGGSAQAHQGEWMSQQQLAQSAFAGQAQLLGRQGQGSRGDRKPGSGRAGPLGLPWSRCSEHRLVELGGPTQPSTDPSLCAGALRSREQGQISQHHLTGRHWPSSCSPCGLHSGSPTRVAPAVHTPAPHIVTDASCIFCVQHTHQHGKT